MNKIAASADPGRIISRLCQLTGSSDAFSILLFDPLPRPLKASKPTCILTSPPGESFGNAPASPSQCQHYFAGSMITQLSISACMYTFRLFLVQMKFSAEDLLITLILRRELYFSSLRLVHRNYVAPVSADVFCPTRPSSDE